MRDYFNKTGDIGKSEREKWLTDKFEENYKLPELRCFNRKITIELFNISKIKA